MAKSKWLMRVGERVRILRTRADKNQAECGVSPTTVGKIEGGAPVTLRALEKMAAAIGLASPDAFFDTSLDVADTDSDRAKGHGPLSPAAKVPHPVTATQSHGDQEDSNTMDLTDDEKAVIALWKAGEFAALRTMMRGRAPRRKTEPRARRGLPRLSRKK